MHRFMVVVTVYGPAAGNIVAVTSQVITAHHSWNIHNVAERIRQQAPPHHEISIYELPPD